MPFTCRKEDLKQFERKILRRIFGPVVQQDGTWRIRMNLELDTLINSENIVKFIKSQRIRWLGHIYRIEKMCIRDRAAVLLL